MRFTFTGLDVTVTMTIKVFPIRKYVNTEMELSETFAERLKELRGKRSQADFARLLGIANPPTYQRYEAGRIPDPEILCQIANQFGVTVDWLLGRDTPHAVVKEAGVEYAVRSLPRLIDELAKLLGVAESEVRKKVTEIINGRKKEGGENG